MHQRNEEKKLCWKFIQPVNFRRASGNLKKQTCLQIKWKQLKQVYWLNIPKFTELKPALNSATLLNTSWIETSLQTSDRKWNSKHCVVVVPQLNINCTSLVKLPTSMSDLYVECWSESSVVWKLKQHKVCRLTLQLMSLNDTADPPPVLVLQLRGSGTGLQCGTGARGWHESMTGGGRQELKSWLFSPKVSFFSVLFHKNRFLFVTNSNTCLSEDDFEDFGSKRSFYGWAEKSFRCLGHNLFGYLRPNLSNVKLIIFWTALSRAQFCFISQ